MNVTRSPSVAPTSPAATGPSGPVPGRALVWGSWAGTAVSCVTSVANAVTGDRDHYALSAVPALVLFALGCAAFLVAFALAVGRSREEQIGVGGLFFLQGCAPRPVQVSMMASLVVQATVPLVVAMVRPFTAFGVLAPVWALGLAGLWGARYGTFPPRTDGTGTAVDAPDSGPDGSRDGGARHE